MQAQKGDLVFVNNSLSTKKPLAGDHAFMVVESGPLKKTTRTVHCTWGGFYIWDFEDQGPDAKTTTYYRCPDTTLAARAADYALLWATRQPELNQSYDNPRAKAMMHDIKSDGNLEYGFDALRRSIKWCKRLADEDPFSKNKGTTCSAFLVAAYQAAAFATIDRSKLDQAWSRLESLRVNKKGYRAAQTLDDPTKVAYREYSNPGAKEADARAQVLAVLKDKTDETDDAFLERLMTKPMVVDARYIHPDGMVKRLKNSVWQQLQWAY